MAVYLKKIRNIIVHIVVLIVVFIVALIGFSRWINQRTPDFSERMSSSTFPLVYMMNGTTSFNCLHGYAEEMDPVYMRDSLTPLNSNRQLQIQIQPFSSTVDSLSYEVITQDGQQSLENTKVVKLKKEGDYIYATLELQNKILMNQEYVLKLQLDAGGRTVYYYTRILLEDGLHTAEYLSYVMGFYERCVNKTDQEVMGAAVEPGETTGDNTSLAYMNIYDTVEQLMWNALNPQIYHKPTPCLKEINENTASVVLEYRISSVNEEGITEVFNVKEFYRLRFTDARVFLLDFERTTSEIFNPDNNVLTDKGINLGLTDKDVIYAYDEKQRIFAFVQENELWTYNTGTGILTQIFSFPQKENMDYRDFYDNHEIRILRVEDSGDVYFLVSGYMNRGDHEGENGIGVYYYEAASSTVDEKVFISSKESSALLNMDVDSLAYITENNDRFYFMLEENVYCVDLNSRECTQVITGVRVNTHAVSQSGRYFAWLKEGEAYASSTLCVMDVETGLTREITSSSDERIRPLAFMEEDLVYGLARQSDIDTSHPGDELFLMYRLVIEDGEGNPVKDYQPSDCYVTQASLSENLLTLTRVKKNGSSIEEAAEDHIVNASAEEDVAYGPSTVTSARKEQEIILRVGSSVTNTTPQVIRAKQLMSSGTHILSIQPNRSRSERYYVYAHGGLDSVFSDPNAAIRRADEMVGVVVTNTQAYVWERGNKPTTKQIAVENIPQAIRQGTMDTAQLEEALGQKVLDLSGCTLDSVLYFVGQGRPVLAQTDKGPVIIAGYDGYNTILLDPGAEETYYCGMDDSTEMFEQAGNIFISYLPE